MKKEEQQEENGNCTRLNIRFRQNIFIFFVLLAYSELLVDLKPYKSYIFTLDNYDDISTNTTNKTNNVIQLHETIDQRHDTNNNSIYHHQNANTKARLEEIQEDKLIVNLTAGIDNRSRSEPASNPQDIDDDTAITNNNTSNVTQLKEIPTTNLTTGLENLSKTELTSNASFTDDGKLLLPSQSITAMQMENSTNLTDTDNPISTTYNVSKQSEQEVHNNDEELIPIMELLYPNGNDSNTSGCPHGLLEITNRHLPRSVTHLPNRKIPKIIHVTGRSKCMSKPFYDNLNLWKTKFPNHSFYFHDDDAINRLFMAYMHKFPGLNDTITCLTSGASMADMWRYLLLHEYGGIYTDMDSAPNLRFDETTIKDTDDSFFVVEQLGVPSQYFMASSKYHPVMNESIVNGMVLLRATKDVMNNQAPYTTGPRALKNGFIVFLRSYGNINATGYEGQGIYTHPVTNRSVTLLGRKGRSDFYVRRVAFSTGEKNEGYANMNMSHFSHAKPKIVNQKISCEKHIQNVHAKISLLQENGTAVEALSPLVSFSPKAMYTLMRRRNRRRRRYL